jgi:hypothetical protein
MSVKLIYLVILAVSFIATVSIRAHVDVYIVERNSVG